jgi:hypothetical protein
MLLQTNWKTIWWILYRYSWVNILLEEAALSRKKEKTKNNLTQVVYFTGKLLVLIIKYSI